MAAATISNQTIAYMALGMIAGHWIATTFMKNTDEAIGSTDEALSYFMGSDDTPPATAPLASGTDDLGPVSTLGARSLGASRLGGAYLGNVLKPRRVYNDPTSNNPAAYRPPTNPMFVPPPPAPKPTAPVAPAPKPALKPASAATTKPKTGGAALKPAKALKSAFMPEIDTRDGLIVQPFN